MLVHVVLIRLQPMVSETGLTDLADRVRDLAVTVAGPGSCVIGSNVTEEALSQEFEFGFVLTFASHRQLDTYHVNPAHLAVSLAIRDLARMVLVFDIGT